MASSKNTNALLCDVDDILPTPLLRRQVKGFLQGPHPAPVTCPFYHSNMTFLPAEGSPVQDRKGMGTGEELVIGKERGTMVLL